MSRGVGMLSGPPRAARSARPSPVDSASPGQSQSSSVARGTKFEPPVVPRRAVRRPARRLPRPGSSRRSARTGTGGCRPLVPVRRLSGFRRGQTRAVIRHGRRHQGLARGGSRRDGHGGSELLAARGKLSCARVVRTTRAQDTRVSVSVLFSFSVSSQSPGGRTARFFTTLVIEFRRHRRAGRGARPEFRRPFGSPMREGTGTGGEVRPGDPRAGAAVLDGAGRRPREAGGEVRVPAVNGRKLVDPRSSIQPAAAASVRGVPDIALAPRSARHTRSTRSAESPVCSASVGQPCPDRAGARGLLSRRARRTSRTRPR